MNDTIMYRAVVTVEVQDYFSPWYKTKRQASVMRCIVNILYPQGLATTQEANTEGRLQLAQQGKIYLFDRDQVTVHRRGRGKGKIK